MSPAFRASQLQTTHHCHRAHSCLGPKHRRLIKVYCRFSSRITLKFAGRESTEQARIYLLRCCAAFPAAAGSTASFACSSYTYIHPHPQEKLHLLPQRKLASHQAKEHKQVPSPYPTVPAGPASGRGSVPPVQEGRRREEPRRILPWLP